MTTAAFVGQMFFERGNADSPETFTRVTQVFSISGVGETNEQVDATSFSSGGTKEFIAGLAEGETITVECNFEQAATPITNLINDVKAKTNRHYRIVVEHSSPHEIFTLLASPISWVLNPSVDGRNTFTFSCKVSGAITIS